eukprot:2169925-Ditylum_brightwellii.AAC.1
MPETTTEVDADTLHLIPHTVPIPQFGDAEVICQEIADIGHVLKQPATNNIPDEMKGDVIVQSFANIKNLLGQKKNTPVPAQPATTVILSSHALPSFLLQPLQVPGINKTTALTIPKPVAVRPAKTQVAWCNQHVAVPPIMMSASTQLVHPKPIIVHPKPVPLQVCTAVLPLKAPVPTNLQQHSPMMAAPKGDIFTPKHNWTVTETSITNSEGATSSTSGANATNNATSTTSHDK